MKKIILCSILLALISCRVGGLTDDFGKLSQDKKDKIIPLTSFESLKPEMIYTINGEQLINELAKHDRALVYVFTNGCTSEFCKPLFVYENFAKAHGYDLFLVMNGFGRLDETLNQPLKTQLFAIDAKYYGTVYRSKYDRYFINDISGKARDYKGDFEGDLFFYSKGSLMKVMKELPVGILPR